MGKQRPLAKTASGGLHVYFANPARELKSTASQIGAGLDVRGEGGYVIVPSTGSGYRWDPASNFDTVDLLPAPEWLWPVKPSRPPMCEPIKPVVGLSPYGEKAIESACRAIIRAGRGEQERTLNAECFSIGTLAGAGAVPSDIALRALLRAASMMPDHDPAYPWRPEEIEFKVKRAFGAGMKHPRAREARRGAA